MRAVVLRDRSLHLEEVANPTPLAGQVLVRTKACGICGSDLHFVRHGEKMLALAREGGSMSTLDLSRGVVLGHEFVGEVLDVRMDSMTTAKVGDRVVSMPVNFVGAPVPENMRAVGYSNDYAGGYSEQMVLYGPLLLVVPNGLSTEIAALTEPMAVGLHAVNKSGIVAGGSAVVHGTGPVGLAVIAALRLLGVEAIIAADYSPKRRALATAMGAVATVDPGVEAAMDVWTRLTGGTLAAQSGLVQFECVGVPGMIDEAMRRAPRHGRITVVGACMEADRMTPMFGINKELQLMFVLAYTPEEFSASLQHLAEGRINAAPLITGTVDLDGVAQAFLDLAHPEHHAKVMVRPGW